MIVGTYEDRLACAPGVKLLLLSLMRNAPDLAIDATFPDAPESFKAWVSRYPSVRLKGSLKFPCRGWDVKPSKLLELLDEGHSEVIWIDSDVIVNKDFRSLLVGLREDEIVVSEDMFWGQRQGSYYRTWSWGMEQGRALPWTANSGFIRVTPRHRELLETWQKLLQHPDYVQAQSQHYMSRPLHLVGDQDVLTALLGSKKFAQFPVRFLKRGTEIIQQFAPAGYTLGERLLNLGHGLPPLVHAMAQKPWYYQPAPDFFREPRRYYDALHIELSPYAKVARQYEDAMGEPCDWMKIRTLPGKLLNALAFGNPTLAEIPTAFFDTIARTLKRTLRMSRFPIVPPKP